MYRRSHDEPEGVSFRRYKIVTHRVLLDPLRYENSRSEPSVHYSKGGVSVWVGLSSPPLYPVWSYSPHSQLNILFPFPSIITPVETFYVPRCDPYFLKNYKESIISPIFTGIGNLDKRIKLLLINDKEREVCPFPLSIRKQTIVSRFYLFHSS